MRVWSVCMYRILTYALLHSGFHISKIRLLISCRLWNRWLQLYYLLIAFFRIPSGVHIGSYFSHTSQHIKTRLGLWLVQVAQELVRFRKLRLATCDLRLATCDLRLATCDLRLATCDLRLATCDLRLATCDLRLAAWTCWWYKWLTG